MRDPTLGWDLGLAGAGLVMLVGFAVPLGSGVGFLRQNAAQMGLRAYAGGAAKGGDVATVKELRRDVRVRPAGKLVWEAARRGERLHDGEAVFVAGGSAARLRYDDGTEINVDENSLVV